MKQIPIPARLGCRPVLQGLVVPYISFQHKGEVFFGNTRGIREAECIVHGLCQACGQVLDQGPYVFLVTQEMLDHGSTGEPPLHPECAAYSAKACPMVSGRMPAYSRAKRDHSGPCTTEGCKCGGVVSTSGPEAGEPAVPWFSAWFPSYAIGVQDASRPLSVENVTSCVFVGAPIKIRPIAPPRPEPDAAEAAPKEEASR